MLGQAAAQPPLGAYKTGNAAADDQNPWQVGGAKEGWVLEHSPDLGGRMLRVKAVLVPLLFET